MEIETKKIHIGLRTVAGFCICSMIVMSSTVTIAVAQTNSSRINVEEYLQQRGLQDDAQARAAVEGVNQDADAAEQFLLAAEGTGANTAECAVGNILANGLKTVFANAVEGLLEEKAEEKTAAVLKVPVDSSVANENLRAFVAKESTSLKLFGVPILPSWDAIGYCLVNAMIEYITISTIEWINNGFEGNPAFLENPEQFFLDVADIEAGQFLGELTGGYICEQFDVDIQLGLLRRQLNVYGDQGYFNNARCTLSEVTENVDSFLDGNFNDGGWGAWFSLTQDPYNNPYDAADQAAIALDQRIALEQNRLQVELDWGDGFLSFRDPETNENTTPGKIIEQRINQRLGSAERRIEMADEFDEIVNALVNELVKIALNKILTETKGNE